MPTSSLALALYQIGAIQFGDFTLKSGQSSPLYINLRKIISHPFLLRHIANAMWETIQPFSCDLICGVPYTALPIATCLSLDHALPMVMRRKEIKDYGTKQRIEGDFKSKQRCLVVEDVITTGMSILETTQDLISAGIAVTDVVALIDREQGGVATLQKQFRVHTVLTVSTLLNTLLSLPPVLHEDKNRIRDLITQRASS